MTVREFISEIPEHRLDDNLVVAKHDKKQLSAYTTVPVKSVRFGIDFEAEKVILEPSIQLSTDPEIVDRNRTKMLMEYSERITKAVMTAAKISAMLDGIQDEELKTRIRDTLKEI